MNDMAVVKLSKSDRTKERIAAVAFERFAVEGYARTGLRDIAELANVAPSLIVKHFTSKANLFRRVLAQALREGGMATYDKEGFGQQVAEHIAHADNGRLTTMIILAVADPESRGVAQELYNAMVLDAMTEWLGPPDARTRALRTLILINGFTIQTRHMMAGDIPQDLVDWLGREIQAIVDAR